MASLPPPLVARLLLLTQLPGLALLVALGLASYEEEREHATRQLHWQAQALAAALGERLLQEKRELHAADLQPLLVQQQLPSRWVAGIADAHGRVATRGMTLHRWPATTQDVAPGGPPVPLLIHVDTPPGTTLVAAVVPARVPGWTALVGVPRDVLQAGLWRTVARDLLPVLVLLLVVLGLSVQLARRSLAQAQLRSRVQRLDALLQAARAQRQQDARSLAAARAELQDVHRTFERELLREAESRQQAIARDLHDAIGSALAGVGILLGSARDFTREPEAVALIGKSQEQVRQATQQIRRILRGMMPVGQDRGALLPALEQFAAEMDATQAVRCTVHARGDFASVPPEVGGHLFRIVQEATANALRHGRARHVRIRLAQAGACCRLSVDDDGGGCDAAVLFGPSAGIGMRSMRARADAIHGHLEARASPGRGLRIRVTWPSADPPALRAVGT